MNYYKSQFNSNLSLEDIKEKIKKYKATSNDFRYYMIHSDNENQLAFGKNSGQLFNLLDSVDTEFKIYLSKTKSIYNIDVKYRNYKAIHYIFILFALFFIFFFNTFLFIAILSITSINFYLIYLITLYIAYYILSKKLIISSINSEIRFIKRIIKFT